MIVSILFGALSQSCPPTLATPASNRQIYLWSWERPEDLRSVGLPKDIGVAYLAATLKIKDSKLRILRRMQPLMMPPGTRTMKVFRLEIDERRRGELSSTLAEETANTIVRLVKTPPFDPTSPFQIDFDARQDERDFYKTFLERIHKELPQTPISITALLSWCLYDTWVTALPCNECVPMFFRMGRDKNNVLVHFKLGRGLSAKQCTDSLGISVDEPDVNRVILRALLDNGGFTATKRVYIFNPRPWTRESIESILGQVR